MATVKELYHLKNSDIKAKRLCQDNSDLILQVSSAHFNKATNGCVKMKQIPGRPSLHHVTITLSLDQYPLHDGEEPGLHNSQ